MEECILKDYCYIWPVSNKACHYVLNTTVTKLSFSSLLATFFSFLVKSPFYTFLLFTFYVHMFHKHLFSRAPKHFYSRTYVAQPVIIKLTRVWRIYKFMMSLFIITLTVNYQTKINTVFKILYLLYLTCFTGSYSKLQSTTLNSLPT